MNKQVAVRGFTARTPNLLTLSCLLVAVPATAQVNYLVNSGVGGAMVIGRPNASHWT